MPRLVSIDEAAAAMKVGRRTLYRWIQAGHLKLYKGGLGDKKSYVDRGAVERLMKPKAR